MTWLRPWFRRKFGPYLKNFTVKETQKYLAVLRLTYFFSVTTLCFLLYQVKKNADNKLEELRGQPVQPPSTIRSYHKIPPAVMYEYKPGKGTTKIYFDKDEYYRQLEEAAYKKVKASQEKALAEGQPLPEGSINLVE